MFEDKTLKCKDCGEQFVFTTGEQEFYAQKGFQNEPARCAPCRRARKRDGVMGRRGDWGTVRQGEGEMGRSGVGHV